MRIFGHYVSRSLFYLGLVEGLILYVSLFLSISLIWLGFKQIHITFFAYLSEATVFTAIFMSMMIAVGLYHRELSRNMRTTFMRLLTAFALAFVLLSMALYLWPALTFGRGVVALALLVSFGGIMLARFIYLRVTGLLTFKSRILVLGAGPQAARIAELEAGAKSPAFSVVAYVAESGKAVKVPEDRVVRGINSLSDYCRQHDIEEIVVAVEERRGGLPMTDLLACKADHIRISECSGFWERETGKVDLGTLNPSWIIFSEGFTGGRAQGISKRVFDVVVSLLLLVFSLPVLILTAILIKLESPGGVIYRQERVGLRGQTFDLYKFRSMRSDAEKDGPRWAAEGDPRVTRIGRFIRKTRIDEIPQIFNVLLGHMSFIGPRPERPFFVQELCQTIPYYNERHQVKPGISGWAQLNYPYGASTEDARQKLQYDLYYIKNYSLFLDILVLMQTIRVILWPDGAR